jgi:hypothetical protein
MWDLASSVEYDLIRSQERSSVYAFAVVSVGGSWEILWGRPDMLAKSQGVEG